jgi:hypothetical protein
VLLFAFCDYSALSLPVFFFFVSLSTEKDATNAHKVNARGEEITMNFPWYENLYLMHFITVLNRVRIDLSVPPPAHTCPRSPSSQVILTPLS